MSVSTKNADAYKAGKSLALFAMACAMAWIKGVSPSTFDDTVTDLELALKIYKKERI